MGRRTRTVMTSGSRSILSNANLTRDPDDSSVRKIFHMIEQISMDLGHIGWLYAALTCVLKHFANRVYDILMLI